MKNRSLKEWLFFIFKLTKDFILELFEPKVSFYAASMSWATLFFIIPMLVITLSIIIYTPMFSQYYEKIHTIIAQSLVPASTEQIMSWLDSFIANAYQMGYIGMAYVIIAAILFFKDLDYIVNDIFGEERRGILRGLLVYSFLTIFVPLAIASSIWVFNIADKTFHFQPYVLQFIIIWLIVFIVFKVTPKEKIRLDALAISSFITTVVWFIAKSAFMFYILHNKTYTTIYGTISIVLFTFLWIYISWTIFLHGMQLCNMLLKENDENEELRVKN